MKVKHMNYTLNNNLIGNNNVLHSIAESKEFINTFGHDGVYGYDFGKYLIPEDIIRLTCILMIII